MIDEKRRDKLVGELIAEDTPRISLYIPTHRAYPDNRQDPIVYKNQLKLVENALEERSPRRDWEKTFEKMQLLLEDENFWMHTTEGLGVLGAGGRAETFLLDSPEDPAFYVGDDFHLLPLYPLIGSLSQAYLADISRDRFIMYYAGSEGITEMEMPDIKNDFSELFDDFDANANLRTGSYGGLSGALHGHGSKPEEPDKDREKYFRYLDGAFASLNKKSGLPVILAGTQDSLNEFSALAKGAFYLDGKIESPLESLSPDDIAGRIKTILKPSLEKSLSSLRTLINNKQNENKAVGDLKDIAAAAQEGRVELLILPQVLRESEQASMDKAAQQVLQNGGRVYSDRGGALELPHGRLALLRY